jgi:hypothetical protein
MRTDPAETFFGVRLNVFTSVIVGLLAVAYFVWQRGRPREVIERGAQKAAEEQPATGVTDDDADVRAEDSEPASEDDHRTGRGT